MFVAFLLMYGFIRTAFLSLNSIRTVQTLLSSSHLFMSGRVHKQQVHEFAVLYHIKREKWKKKHTRMLKMIDYMCRHRRYLLRNILSLQLVAASLLSISQGKDRKSRGPREVRQTGWWKMAWGEFSEARFKKTFRINRDTSCQTNYC